MIPTGHCAQLGALTPLAPAPFLSQVSRYLQKMPAPESSYHSKADLPTWQGASTALQSCPMLLVTTRALLCPLSAIISQNISSRKSPAAPEAKTCCRKRKNLHHHWTKLKGSRRTAINCVGVSQQLWDFLPLLLWWGKNSSASSPPGSSQSQPTQITHRYGMGKSQLSLAIKLQQGNTTQQKTTAKNPKNQKVMLHFCKKKLKIKCVQAFFPSNSF